MKRDNDARDLNDEFTSAQNDNMNPTHEDGAEPVEHEEETPATPVVEASSDDANHRVVNLPAIESAEDELEATGSLKLTDLADSTASLDLTDALGATGALDRTALENDEDPYESVDDYEDDEYDEYETTYEEITDFDSDGSPAWEGNMPKNGYRRKDKRRKWPILVLILVLLLVAGYGFGVYYYSGRMLPNTSIGRRDVSGLTPEQARQALEDETASYECNIELEGLNSPISGKAISLERDEEGMVNRAHAMQSPFTWPLTLLAHDGISVEQGVTFDEDALLSEITKAIDARNQQSLSADGVYISFDDAQDCYVIGGSVSGTVADAKVVDEAVRADVAEFKETSTPSASSALRAATIDDLPQFRYTVDWANHARTNDIPILVNGEEKITAEASQNAQWVTVGDGPSIVVDQDAIREWAEGTVADAVYYQDEEWMDHLLDVDAFVSELSKRLSTGVSDPIDAPMYEAMSSEGESREKAYKRGSWDSSMGRYIDVDLEAQFARLFDEKGEVIWESAIVSGDTSEGHSTVTGTFEVYNKQTNATLVGLDYDGDGKPDYQSNVSYWMPFYGGYGLHDATWRYSFGGETYSYDGSHGCVNLPYSKAEELFNMISVGEKVNVHW